MKHKDEDRKFCLGYLRWLQIRAVVKRMPDGKAHRLNQGDCEARCRTLWPQDQSTYPLCEVTQLEPGQGNYGERVFPYVGLGADNARTCFWYDSGEWDWLDLKDWGGH